MKINALKLFVLVLFGLVLSSCEKESSIDYETDQVLSEEILEEEPDQNQQSKFTNGKSWVGFNWPAGPYTRSRANSDFGDTGSISNTELNRLSITTGTQLSVKLLKNSTGSNGGQFAKIPIQRSTNAYTLKYRIKFPSNFEWGLGGKIPGLSGGAAYSGCTGSQARSKGDGWTSRIMWTKPLDGSAPHFYPYIYYSAMTGNCGNKFNKRYNIVKNKWYSVEMYVKMNTGTNSNGILRIKINGTTLINQTNMKWVTKNAGREIDGMMFGVYRGGNDSNWWVSKDTNILFDSFQLIKG
ncbi:polysaccharide lyase [Flavivirga rizhaonensis]|uniref:Polysaccharide lyase 14 domain-containing protein n=1 Tax=Flavivirga rizhaonensis TaxID=2559571 RepID=A0A4S1DYV6_9FLAO|nr:hypothetical protein [Flavivirga rizhaonensis]TGV02742.1 hypothetical protein EM932_09945 [Flavivirga rizhaonensis]